MAVERLLAVDPALRQIVKFNTNKNQDKVLDIICTDLSSGFQEPTKLPAIKIDEGRDVLPTRMGVICSILLFLILIAFTGYKISIL